MPLTSGFQIELMVEGKNAVALSTVIPQHHSVQRILRMRSIATNQEVLDLHAWRPLQKEAPQIRNESCSE